MKYPDALDITNWMVKALQPTCVRCEPAGSMRRRRVEVHDIEIVAIPDLTPPRVQFGQRKIFKTRLDEVLNQLFEEKFIGLELNGDKQKKLNVYRPGDWNPVIQIDLFLCTPPSQWGVLFAIRTGPAKPENNFSRWIVTQRWKGGCLPDGYFVKHNVVWVESEIHEEDVPDNPVKAVKVMTATNHIPMPEEMDFLNFLELGWIEPGNRMVRHWVRGTLSTERGVRA